MKVRELLEELSNLPLHHRDLEVYIDTEGDEYREMELIPIVEVSAKDDSQIIGYIICESKPDDDQPVLPLVIEKKVH